jgi:hypothetical protein
MRVRRAGAVLVAVLVAATAISVIAVGTAPAGNRDPIATLVATPGPAEVTYGQGVALTASLENTQKSTFTDVRFVLPLPSGASVVATTCASQTVEAGQLSCFWGHQLRAGKTATVVVVLKTPTSGASPLSLSGTWTIKEGLQDSGAPDTFPTNAIAIGLLAATDPDKAGGFATTACSSPSTPTIATNQNLGPGNPLATSICAPNLPTLPITGIVAGIEEREGQPSEPGVSEVSDICLPAPTFACGGQAYVFSPQATFTFRLDNTQLPQVCPSTLATQSGGGGCTLLKITTVYHDGDVVSSSPTADPRVVSITFNKATKTTTVVVKSSKNGDWRFG